MWHNGPWGQEETSLPPRLTFPEWQEISTKVTSGPGPTPFHQSADGTLEGAPGHIPHPHALSTGAHQPSQQQAPSTLSSRTFLSVPRRSPATQEAPGLSPPRIFPKLSQSPSSMKKPVWLCLGSCFKQQPTLFSTYSTQQDTRNTPIPQMDTPQETPRSPLPP